MNNILDISWREKCYSRYDDNYARLYYTKNA